MKHIVRRRPVWILLLTAAVLAGAAQAGAAPSADKPVAAKAKKKTGASRQVRFIPGSEETAAQRNSRLKRECQGRVNAGACTGYTR